MKDLWLLFVLAISSFTQLLPINRNNLGATSSNAWNVVLISSVQSQQKAITDTMSRLSVFEVILETLATCPYTILSPNSHSLALCWGTTLAPVLLTEGRSEFCFPWEPFQVLPFAYGWEKEPASTPRRAHVCHVQEKGSRFSLQATRRRASRGYEGNVPARELALAGLATSIPAPRFTSPPGAPDRFDASPRAHAHMAAVFTNMTPELLRAVMKEPANAASPARGWPRSPARGASTRRVSRAQTLSTHRGAREGDFASKLIWNIIATTREFSTVT